MDCQYATDQLALIAHQWGLQLHAMQPQIEIAGSPERCEYRTVIEDDQGRRFVLEQIAHAVLARKLRIIKILNHLHAQGLEAVVPYWPTLEGELLVAYGNSFWQLLPYVAGTPLERPEYTMEQWRGEVLADFLIKMRAAATAIPQFGKTVFSIAAYVKEMVRTLAQHQPALLKRLQAVADFLRQRFAREHDRLPTAFSHGDYHPLNIIWGPADIRAVIDWEFAGYKPDIYDVAILLGCLGIEDPPALTGPLTMAYIQKMRATPLITNSSWAVLVEFMLAQRFGWLSEWLRKDDQEMIELEVVYMHLLMENAPQLTAHWDLNA